MTFLTREKVNQFILAFVWLVGIHFLKDQFRNKIIFLKIYVKCMKGEGLFLKRTKAYKGRGRAFKNHQISAYTLFKWPLFVK